MILYSEGPIFGVKLKSRNIGGYIRGFIWCFTVFAADPCYKFFPISRFGPLLSKNPRCVFVDTLDELHVLFTIF